MQMASSFRVTPQTGWTERGCSCRNNTSVVGCDIKLPCSLWLWHGFIFVVPSLSGAERNGKLPSNACTGWIKHIICTRKIHQTSFELVGKSDDIGLKLHEIVCGAHSTSIITDQKYIEIHRTLLQYVLKSIQSASQSTTSSLPKFC